MVLSVLFGDNVGALVGAGENQDPRVDTEVASPLVMLRGAVLVVKGRRHRQDDGSGQRPSSVALFES